MCRHDNYKPMDEILIIGAGASALIAGKTLAEKGIKVQLLEARDRIGGRIHTLATADWGYCAEAGAEFVHGNLPLTLDLLQQANQSTHKVRGAMYQVFLGEWQKSEYQVEHQQLVIDKLQQLQQDISMADFVEQEFAGEAFEELRLSLLGYVEGYYSGDAKRTSAKTFLSEWMSEDEEQYRPASGYTSLMKFLASSILSAVGNIHLNCTIKQIKWSKSQVQAIDANNNMWQADKLINTVPLGVWTADEQLEGAINYNPALPFKKEAAQQMGFGSVIKVLIRFTEPFYHQLMQSREDTGFIFSGAEIPTWWTQYPLPAPVITGWLAGPKAFECRHLSNPDIYQRALQSLTEIFNLDKNVIEGQVLQHKVINWTADPFTRGAYAYSTLQTKQARKIMAAPVDNTLFFAGEALYEGTETGTVEAALTSGINTANQILKCLQ